MEDQRRTLKEKLPVSDGWMKRGKKGVMIKRCCFNASRVIKSRFFNLIVTDKKKVNVCRKTEKSVPFALLKNVNGNLLRVWKATDSSRLSVCLSPLVMLQTCWTCHFLFVYIHINFRFFFCQHKQILKFNTDHKKSSSDPFSCGTTALDTDIYWSWFQCLCRDLPGLQIFWGFLRFLYGLVVVFIHSGFSEAVWKSRYEQGGYGGAENDFPRSESSWRAASLIWFTACLDLIGATVKWVLTRIYNRKFLLCFWIH